MTTKIVSIFVCMLVITVSMTSALGLMLVKNKDIIEEKRINMKDKNMDNEDEPPIENVDTILTKLTIPAAAFIPALDFYKYSNSGYSLNGGGVGIYFFEAPVYLPDEAEIEVLDLYFYDINENKDCYLTLNSYYPSAHEYYELAQVKSSGSTGFGFSYDDTIDYSKYDVDYCYYLELVLQDEIQFRGASIIYSYEVPDIVGNTQSIE